MQSNANKKRPLVSGREDAVPPDFVTLPAGNHDALQGINAPTRQALPCTTQAHAHNSQATFIPSRQGLTPTVLSLGAQKELLLLITAFDNACSILGCSTSRP